MMKKLLFLLTLFGLLSLVLLISVYANDPAEQNSAAKENAKQTVGPIGGKPAQATPQVESRHAGKASECDQKHAAGQCQGHPPGGCPGCDPAKCAEKHATGKCQGHPAGQCQKSASQGTTVKK